MDASEALGLILYVAILFGLLYIIIAIIYWVIGNEKYKSLLLWGSVLLVLGMSGFSIITWLFGGVASSAVQTGFIVTPQGELDAAKYYPIDVRIIPILLPNGSNWWYVKVDWGDGASTGEIYPHYFSPLEPIELTHSYYKDGVYNMKIHLVLVKADYGPEGPEITSVVESKTYNVEVNVTSPWEQYATIVKNALENITAPSVPNESLNETTLGHLARAFKSAILVVVKTVGVKMAGAFAFITDVLARATVKIGLNPGQAYYYLVSLPTTKNFPGMEKTYMHAQLFAQIILVLLALFGLLERGIRDPFSGSEGLVDWLKTVLLAEAGIYVILPLYDLAARSWNIVTLSLARLDQLGSIYIMLTSMVITLSAASIISPGAGSIVGLLLLTLLGTVVLGILKYIAVAALVAALPIIIALSPIGELKPLVNSIIRMLTGMFIFTLLAAIVTNLTVEASLNLANTSQGQNLILSLAIPIISTVAGYWITGMISPGALPGTGLIAHRIISRGAAAGAALPAPIPMPSQAGLVAPRPAQGTFYAAGAPGYAAGAALSGAVVGTVPTPTAGPARGNIGYVHTGPPMIGPTPVRQESSREVASLAPPAGSRRQRATGAIRTLHEMATGKAKPAPTAPKRVKAAYYAARATSKLASHVKRQLLDFDRVLQRELGISLIEKPVTKRIAPTARYTLKAARLAAPHLKRYGGKFKNWLSEQVRSSVSRNAGRVSVDEAH